MAEQILPGDVVRTRKVHPCGGDEWTVLRTGADIRIRCNTCGAADAPEGLLSPSP